MSHSIEAKNALEQNFDVTVSSTTRPRVGAFEITDQQSGDVLYSKLATAQFPDLEEVCFLILASPPIQLFILFDFRPDC